MRRGIPQGSPISPVLANHLHAPVRAGMEACSGWSEALARRLVTYADDLVILCRKGKAEEAVQRLRADHGQAEAGGERGEDAHLFKAPDGDVRLPGIHVRANVFGEDRRGPYLATCGRQRKAFRRVVEKVHDWLTDQEHGLARDHNAGGAKLNRTLRGWANYFQCRDRHARRIGRSTTYTAVRLRRWLRSKHTRSGDGRGGSYPLSASLRALRARTSEPACGMQRAVDEEREGLSESLMREICMSGSMSGMWKRSHGLAHRAPPTERGGNSDARPTVTAPHLDSTGMRPWGRSPFGRPAWAIADRYAQHTCPGQCLVDALRAAAHSASNASRHFSSSP